MSIENLENQQDHYMEYQLLLKDIIGTVDMPTECGTSIRKGKSYSQNAEIVDLLLSAGAIVMGKTTTSELAYLGPSKTTNPHDHTRTPGGSSSGSAACCCFFYGTTFYWHSNRRFYY